MGFNDWDFFTRVTEDTIPSSIGFVAEEVSPLANLKSLRVLDGGQPAVATVAGILKPSLETNLDSGRIQSLFLKKTGSGFRDSGLFFLSSSRNPLQNSAKGYAIYAIDGSCALRVVKFANGLHDFASETELASVMVPFSGSNETIAMEVEWRGGIFSVSTGSVNIETRFASNTADFGSMVSVSTVNDATMPFNVGHAGFFVRSRNSVEPLDSIIDDTSLWKRDFI